jgi:hypothetical protein
MANSKRTRAYRGGSRRTSGSGALVDTVRSTIGQLTGKRGRSSSRGGGVGSQATGFLRGLMEGGRDGGRRRGGGRRRR